MLLACMGCANASVPHDPAPVVPRAPIVLFDGKEVGDLSRFYTWLAHYGYADPHRVFTVVDRLDGGPAVRISGQDFGGLVTRRSFADYRLVVEYRWGDVTWRPREARVRNSGILFHGTGEDGNFAANFRSPWVSSIEYEIAEGITGDLLLLRGFVPGGTERIDFKLTARVRWGGFPDRPDGRAPTPLPPGPPPGPGRVGYRVWHPQGEPVEFSTVPGSAGGRVEWLDKDPAWSNVLGFRGRREVEKPPGQWNRVELIADRDRLVFLLNGVKVNEASGSSLTSGRLLFQSEGSEVFYRRIELHPLDRALARPR